jgi:diguanylate cyclase (GGDEF)-like protein/PAS domain S-box-containing protein
MGIPHAAQAGKARGVFQSHQQDAAALPLAMLRAYPGAAFVLAQHGTILSVDGQNADLAANLPASVGWKDLVSRSAAAIERRTASIEILDMGREAPVEATLLPLDDGRRALVLLRSLEFANALHHSLVESRQRYKDFVETISDFCWETDPEGRFTFVSPKGAFEWTAGEMIGRCASEFLAGQDRDAPVPEIFRTRSLAQNDDIWFRCADGTTECLSVTASPLWDDEGGWRGSRGLCRKVTEQRRHDDEVAQMRLQSQLTAHLVHTVQDETDPRAALASVISATGFAVCASGGAMLRDAGGSAFAEAAHWGQSAAEGLVDRACLLFDAGVPIDDLYGDLHVIGIPTTFRGDADGLALFWREVERGLFTAEDQATLEAAARPLGAALARLVSFENALALSRGDPLTGLLNRRAFREEAGRRIARLKQDSEPACLFFVDLDNFKLVNDVCGHQAGDAVLIEVTRILRESTRPGDLLGRLGGDEFVVWLDNTDRATAAQRAAAILGKCRMLGDRSGDPANPFGASIGLALYDGARPESIDEILMRADVAMYRAKRQHSGFALAGTAEAYR